MIDSEVENLSRIFQTHSLVLSQAEGQESWAFLGEDSLAWIVLAFGAAMVVGNLLAVLKPPKGQAERAPVGRTVVMISIGALAAIWGLASLLR